jgi:hypothetical protein
MKRITLALLCASFALVGASPASADGTPGCPGQLNAAQAQAGQRAELVAAAREAARAAGSNFGQVQSTFNHTFCGHGQP